MFSSDSDSDSESQPPLLPPPPNLLIAFETITIGAQIIAVILNGAIVLCTLRKKSLIKCPSTKFVFSLSLSHLLISFLGLLISTVTPFMSTRSHSAPAHTSSRSRPTISPYNGDGDDYESWSSSAIAFPGTHTQMRLNYHANLELSTLHSSAELQITTADIFNHVILYLTLIVSLGTSFTVALISVERYITIARPMKYKSIITSRRSTLCIASCWLFSLVLILVPVLNFGNQVSVYQNTFAFAVPTGALGLYYAFLFSLTTLGVLFIMTVCYGFIFRIAKEKCQKVQIGHFTAPVSSISSDWASSVYSSQGQLDSLPPHASPPVYNSALSLPITVTAPTPMPIPSPSPLSSGGGSALLQYVLTANLGKQQSKLPSPSRITAATSSCGDNTKRLSAFISAARKHSSGSMCDHACACDFLTTPHAHHRRMSKLKRWTSFLQQNYNSPRKTVSTILLLISSLSVTQIPLSIALFCTPPSAGVPPMPLSLPNTGFPDAAGGRSTFLYFCIRLLFALSSIANPILYGFLNRNIRSHLWKFARAIRRRSQNQVPSRPRRHSSYNLAKMLAALKYTMYLPKPTAGGVGLIPSPSEVVDKKKKAQVHVGKKVDKQDADADAGVLLISNVNVNCQQEKRPEDSRISTTASTPEATSVIIDIKNDDCSNRSQNGEIVSNSYSQELPTENVTLALNGCDSGYKEQPQSQHGVLINVTSYCDCDCDDEYEFADEMDEDEIDDYDEIMDEELLSLSSLPRKPSQDSGADMRFSDDSEFEEEEDDESGHGHEKEAAQDEDVGEEVDKSASSGCGSEAGRSSCVKELNVHA